jgi:hypothetical protein
MGQSLFFPTVFRLKICTDFLKKKNVITDCYQFHSSKGYFAKMAQQHKNKKNFFKCTFWHIHHASSNFPLLKAFYTPTVQLSPEKSKYFLSKQIL